MEGRTNGIYGFLRFPDAVGFLRQPGILSVCQVNENALTKQTEPRIDRSITILFCHRNGMTNPAVYFPDNNRRKTEEQIKCGKSACKTADKCNNHNSRIHESTNLSCFNFRAIIKHFCQIENRIWGILTEICQGLNKFLTQRYLFGKTTVFSQVAWVGRMGYNDSTSVESKAAAPPCPAARGLYSAGHGLKSKCPAGASFSAHVV